MAGTSAYTLYDLLRALIERVGWPTEAEKRAAVDSVNEAEAMGVLGTMAKQLACPHESVRRDGICEDCGGNVVTSPSGGGTVRRAPYERQGWR